MSYKIGQLTSVSSTSAFTPKTATPTTVATESQYELQGIKDKTFTDKCYFIKDESFATDTVYSLQVNIKKPTSDIKIDNKEVYPNGIFINVLLADNDNNTIQKIDQIEVPLGETDNQIYSQTLSFIPIKTGNKIIFEMIRGQQDYFGNERKWLITNDNLWLEDNNNIKILNNIKPDGNKAWKRIGFQSRPGTKIIINKVPITVGRSGIFELNVGVDITEFRIVENSNGQIDPFILDYTYQS